MAPRGRGGKFSKPSRGGGKHYSRDVQPVDKNGNLLGLWRDPADRLESSSEDDEDQSSGSQDSSSDEADDGLHASAGPSGEPSESSLTREQRRAAAKAKKQAAVARKNRRVAQPGDLPPTDSEESDDDDLPANPNHTAKARSQLEKEAPAAKPAASNGDFSQLSRREREAIQAQQAQERYMKLHAEGKTDQARADLARLALIREQREAERQRREAEKEDKAAREKERLAAREEREKKLREAAMGKAKKGHATEV